MGAILAKRKAEKAKKEARAKAGFHPKRIYYDEYGNLRHGAFFFLLIFCSALNLPCLCVGRVGSPEEE